MQVMLMLSHRYKRSLKRHLQWLEGKRTKSFHRQRVPGSMKLLSLPMRKLKNSCHERLLGLMMARQLLPSYKSTLTIKVTATMLENHSIQGDVSLDGVHNTAVLASTEGTPVNQASLLIDLCDMLVADSKHSDQVKGNATFEKIGKEIFGDHVDPKDMLGLIFFVHDVFKSGFPASNILKGLQHFVGDEEDIATLTNQASELIFFFKKIILLFLCPQLLMLVIMTILL
jgi:hypothetical protein